MRPTYLTCSSAFIGPMIRVLGRGGGAGIGLAIVKELVAAHGGEVGAQSCAGETVVWFSLPLWSASKPRIASS